MSPLNRRQFLSRTTTTAAGLFLAAPYILRSQSKLPASEWLNIGFVGTAGQANYSLSSLKDQNIVALCDVDETKLNAAAQKFPEAKKYRDFRKLIDQKGLDAIVVATPDHTHAVASIAALQSGRHLYCEKPLTRTVSEARIVTETARKLKRVTQIGTQIHAEKNYRRVVELVKSGAVGDINEVHVWVNSSYGGRDQPKAGVEIPKNLDWDMWLGPVPKQDYSPDFAPFGWRNWWAFGGGSLADFGCHYMDLPFWALDLHHPVSIEAEGPPVSPTAPPTWMIVRYEFPERIHHGRRSPAVKLTWYHGSRNPGRHPESLTPEQYEKWRSGVLFVGSKGQLIADYGRHALWPEKDFEGFVKPTPFIQDSIGHHKEWVEAIKLGGTTTCRFDYSGPLTETALLGNVAYRAGKKLDWDFDKLRATNCPEADEFIQHHYRRGWKI